MHERIYFTLDIPAQEMARYYRGSATRVLVHAADGRRVQIPAANLRPFVTRDGVQGRFCLTVDADYRLLHLERVS